MHGRITQGEECSEPPGKSARSRWIDKTLDGPEPVSPRASPSVPLHVGTRAEIVAWRPIQEESRPVGQFSNVDG